MANLNPAYTVVIKQTVDPRNPSAGGATIVAPMPESFTFDSKSEYSAPYAQGLFGDNAISKALKLGGIRLTQQALTAQIWQGSTDTSLHLELEFNTDTDPDLDVRQPVLALLKMSTASIDKATGMLTSPGPSITYETLVPTLKSVGGAVVDTATGGVANAFTDLKQGLLGTPTDTKNGQGAANTPTSATVKALKASVGNQISVQVGQYAFFDSVVITNVQQTYSHQMDALTGLPLHAKVAFDFTPLFLVVQSDLDQIFHKGMKNG